MTESTIDCGTNFVTLLQLVSGWCATPGRWISWTHHFQSLKSQWKALLRIFTALSRSSRKAKGWDARANVCVKMLQNQPNNIGTEWQECFTYSTWPELIMWFPSRVTVYGHVVKACEWNMCPVSHNGAIAHWMECWASDYAHTSRCLYPAFRAVAI